MIKKIFSWLLIVPVLLPLVYMEGLLYPYMTLKIVLLRALGIASLSCFVYLYFSGESFYWNRLANKASWLPAILLFVAFIASILGVDFYHSFWSTFERGDGLLTLAVLVWSFYAILLYSDKGFFLKMLKWISVTGALTALYALLQWVEIKTGVNIPVIQDMEGRIGGTLNNAAFLSGYLAMTVFVTIPLLKYVKGLWVWLIYAVVALELFVILLSGTRGTIVAFGLLSIVSLITTSIFSKGNLKKGAIGGLIFLVVLGSIFFIFREQVKKIPFEPVQRIASISLSDATVSSRVFVWSELIQKVYERPILGYGAENIDTLYDDVYDPSAISEQWFDRSHNSFLDYQLQYGIFGFVIYILLISLLVFYGWKLWKKEEVLLGGSLMAVSLVYSVHNFFVFDTAMTFGVFLVFFAGALVFSDERMKETKGLSFKLSKTIGCVLSVIVIYFIIPAAIIPYRANALLAEGYKNHVADVVVANEYMRKGFALQSYGNLEYGYNAYVMYTERQSKMLSGSEKISAYQYAFDVLKSNFDRFKYDARTSTYLAHVIDLAPSEVDKNEDLLNEALDRSIELSPKRTQAWYLKANIPIRKADVSKTKEEKDGYYKEAISIIEKYSNLVQKDAEPYFIIANLYLTIGDTDQSSIWAEEGANLFNGDARAASQATKYYIQKEEWKNASLFLASIVENDEDDYDSLYDLSKLYHLMGESQKAQEIVDRIMIEKPGLVETDPVFLKSLGEAKK